MAILPKRENRPPLREVSPQFAQSLVACVVWSQSHFLKSYLHKVSAESHPSPLCPLCITYTHDTNHFNWTHIRITLSPLDLWSDSDGVTELLDRWTEKLAGEPEAGISDSPPPLARVIGWVDNNTMYITKILQKIYIIELVQTIHVVSKFDETLYSLWNHGLLFKNHMFTVVNYFPQI